MKKHEFTTFWLVSSSLLVFLTTGALAQSQHREITRGKERELSVFMDIAFGSIVLERGEKGKIAVLDYEEEKEDEHKFQVSYDVDGDCGRLRIKLKKTKSLWRDNNDDNNYRRLTVKLTDALPVSLELELGAGKGDLDLSGIQIRDLRISSGASSVELRCDEPNSITAEMIQIESGVSKFTATNLCNTNFRKLRFSGGVGAYKLDFGGRLRQDANAKVEVGLGSIVVYIPKEVAAKILYDDSWFSSFDVDRDFRKRRSGVYETTEDESDKKLTIEIESGLGSVRVRRK
ncbi:MAG: hypothetical protein HY562_00510 [Ignavibacteriales bacterium]|nr:hypothetical protein [Ignavibacteriales bacterium]